MTQLRIEPDGSKEEEDVLTFQHFCTGTEVLFEEQNSGIFNNSFHKYYDNTLLYAQKGRLLLVSNEKIPFLAMKIFKNRRVCVKDFVN